MQKRTLGKTGFEAGVIGFGGIPLQKLSRERSTELLHQALDLGINFIDTARGYTDSEEKIGRALRDRRHEYILATKALSRDAEGMASELATSLSELRTDCIDLYQIHALPSVEVLEDILAPGGAYQVLAQAREEGRIKSIGVTGHGRPVLQRAIETGLFDTVQHPFNPIEDEWSDDVIPAAKRAGMGIIAMKPIAGGAISSVPAALRFELDSGIDVLIPGMDSLAQLEENTAVGRNLRPPDEADLQACAADKKTWDGEFCRRCGYCLPCPNGLQIPFLLLIQAYYERYDLADWALERLAGLERKYGDCIACGECLPRCPYNLPIPELMAKADRQVR
ncbi:MAG: aldo/keto reductase [bacterium]|nr:aldo/keto reductase [bacterium]